MHNATDAVVVTVQNKDSALLGGSGCDPFNVSFPVTAV